MTEAAANQWVREVNVIETRFAEFETVLAKIARKGEKLGRMPLVWNVTGVSTVEVIIDKTAQQLRSFTVEIFGEDCRIDGYRPLATVEIAGEDGRAVIEPYCLREGDVERIEKYDALIRSRAGQCDHCNENRLRKYSVVLIDDNDDLKIVGRTCINDFSKNSFDALRYLGWLKSTIEGFSGWTMPRDTYTPTFEFLSAIACFARQHGGYVSQRKADQTGRLPTMNYYYALYQGNAQPAPQCPAAAIPTDEDKQLARDTMAFVEALVPQEGEGIYTYQKNLRDLMAGVTAFSSKKAALVASAIGYYQGNLERERRLQVQVAAKQAAAPAQAEATAPTYSTSSHVGVVDQRMKHVAVKFLSKKFIRQSDFGSVYLFRMVTLGGDVINYFSTAAVQMDPDKDYVVSFTVKKHDNFRGVNQTIIGRMTNHGAVK